MSLSGRGFIGLKGFHGFAETEAEVVCRATNNGE